MIAFTWMTNKKRLIKPVSFFSLIRLVCVHNTCVHFSSSLKSDKEVKKSRGRSGGSSQDGGHLTTEWAPTMVVSSGLRSLAGQKWSDWLHFRQDCRLNICRYNGCICQFNKYIYKYWDDSAVYSTSALWYFLWMCPCYPPMLKTNNGDTKCSRMVSSSFTLWQLQ